MTPAEQRVAELDLSPHPEGGYYREIHRSSYSTAIIFLLPAGGRSCLHAVHGAEEIWHFYQGDPLELHLLGPSGHLCHLLSPARRTAVVPPDVWQAARPLPGTPSAGYSLVGCTVSPPFRFDRFSMAERAALTEQFPEHAGLIAELT